MIWQVLNNLHKTNKFESTWKPLARETNCHTLQGGCPTGWNTRTSNAISTVQSNTGTISKIFKASEFIKKKQVVSKLQFGFRELIYTGNLVYKFTRNIIKSLNNNCKSLTVLLDDNIKSD